ncbi:MAG: DUF2057 family protein [Vibrio sp.]
MLTKTTNRMKHLSLLAILTMSSSAFANVTLTVPANVDLHAVNGQKPDISTVDHFLASEKQVVLPDGWNQIVFDYHPNINQGNELIQIDTDTIIAKFNANQTELTFEFPKYRNEREARQFDDNPDWKLVTKDGQSVEFAQDKLIKNGLQLGRNFPEESQAYNAKGGPAAVVLQTAAQQPVTTSAQVSAPVVASTAAVATTATVAAQPTATAAQVQSSGKYQNTEEEMLHYWYQKADAQTKQRFIREILN